MCLSQVAFGLPAVFYGEMGRNWVVWWRDFCEKARKRGEFSRSFENYKKNLQKYGKIFKKVLKFHVKSVKL